MNNCPDLRLARVASRAIGFTVLMLLVMLAPPPFVRGQAVTASLPVRVSDTNGAAVAGATVTVRNVETGLERTQTTDDSGLTTFVGLPPGRYEIEVSARGFNKKLAAADVNVSRSEELSLLMDVGTPETVTISAVDDREDPLEDLPNINRDLTPLLQVIPGAAAANPTALGRIVTDAKGKEQQSQRLDGLDVTPLTELPSGDPALSILDSLAKNNVAINSVKTLTYAGQLSFEPPGGGEPIYDLSRPYGPGTGTLLEGISYRGSDGAAGKWKFQLAEAMRNDALNARNFFEYEGRNPLRRNQFGGKAGGPLGGSASLFLAYDGIRAGAERNVYEAVPADAFCRCGGGPVAPLLGGYLPPGTSIVQGASNDASNFLVARRRVRSSGDGNAWDARLDVAGVARAVTGVSDFVADLFTLRFTRQAAQFLVPDGVTGRAQRQGVVLAHGVARLAFGKGNFSHELKFGINESRSYSLVDLPTTTDPRLAQSLVTVGGSVGVSNLPGNPATVPGAALGGLVRGSGRGFEQTPVSFTAGYSLVASLTQSHLMEAGFEARLIRMDFDRFGGLTYTFPDVTAMRSGTASLVNFLSDLSGPSPFNEGRGPRRAAQEYYLSYFQGRWRRSPRVTLSYGLRYDYFGVPRERDGRAFLIDPDNGTPLSPQVPFYRASKLNFQPRAGVSLQLTDNTFLRGGAGFFSGAPRIGDLLLPIESDRFNTGRTAVAFPTTATEVIRSFVASPETREFQPLSFARDFSTPERVFRWDLMLTHTFKRVNDLNVTYSGNVGRNLPVAGIANRIVGVQNDPDPARPAIVRREFDIVRGGLLSRPFGELQYRTSRGRSSFNGLTIQFRRNNASLKTSEHWLDWQNFKSFSAQYTLSRNVGNVSGAVASNTLDFDGDFGYNASDARHLFSVSTSYRLWDDANGRDRRDIIWGWTVSPTVNMRSGLPLVVRLDRPDVVYVDAAGTVFGSPAAGRQAVINTPGGGSSGGARVPDLVPGVNPFLRSDLQLLNPAAFAIPEPGRFGNLKRGALRGPGSFTVDLALTRVLFNATELAGKYGIAADFKMEVTNIFNRANFSNPVSSLPNVLGTSLAGDRLQPGAPFTRLAAGQTFGVINAAEAGRQIQFSLVFKFNEGF